MARAIHHDDIMPGMSGYKLKGLHKSCSLPHELTSLGRSHSSGPSMWPGSGLVLSELRLPLELSPVC